MATKTKVAKAPQKAASTKTASTKTAPKKSGKGASMSLGHDEIARQAYMLWLERGGSDMDNWLEAEKQLR